MKTVAVYTKNELLYQKLLLSAPSGVRIINALKESLDTTPILTICDVDTTDALFGAVTVGRKDGADVKVPFAIETLASLIESAKNSTPKLSLLAKERSVLLYGKKIKLTELEFKLLHTLFSSNDFVSRSDILRDVWGDSADEGIINVYVHYLREKLEWRGEKIIISSRKFGYKISESFK